ncbi:amidohydrolase family protein [Nocardioides sp. Y6]|uniref:Amidohydrolase family protein n=1 Tax=Nocardioides malaquae TaxID=2773426 RepID=A0ABR9RWB3_9ACTN|nr:amidohydrolase family protein [Nocardioides malaquae]MBE7325818.1 amidohydrolase family protein [Nocardioides malaquae]
MLIRNVRPVPLTAGLPGVPGGGVPASSEPVDLELPDAGEPGQVVDADGAWAIPGLWDAHVHLGQWTLATSRLDTSEADSVEQALDLVRARLAERPGEAVVGFGHRPRVWPARPTTEALDRVTEAVPIVLVSGDAHHGWLNSTALRLLGLAHREEVVSEDEWFDASARLSDVLGSERVDAWAYEASLRAAAALGLTGLVDLEFGDSPLTWADRWTPALDLLRVRTGTYAADLDDVIAAGLRTGDAIEGHDRLRVGPLKVISDGALTTGTAWCCEEYANTHPPTQGAPNQSPEELRELLTRATGAGWEVAVHAIGDRAVQMALDAVEAAGAHGSVEHAQLVRLEDVRRMAALGVRASVQPAHLIDDRDITDRVWPGRGARSFALRWMVDSGVQLALGSDAPVSRLDPWLAMAAAVHRSGDEREPWHPEQSLTAREALAASVDGVRRLREARDVVLLADDPLRDVGPSAEVAAHLVAMRRQVLATIVDGRVVHHS